MEGSVDVPQQARFELQIRLRTGEEVLHDLAKLRTPPHEVDHAAGDRTEEHSATKQPFCQSSTVGKIKAEIAGDQLAVGFRISLPVRIVQKNLAGQVTGSDGVVESFARNGIHQTTGIAYRNPTIPGQAIVAPPARVQRRQHMPIKLGIVPRNT